MQSFDGLLEGYRRFIKERYPHEAELYRTLAEHGQSPKALIIACCDSRAAPAQIFSTSPGQLFVVRNVANLVPHADDNRDYVETRAAIEFAVNGLAVETIVVMGHADCGGVRHCLEGGVTPDSLASVGKWTSQLARARDEVRGRMPDESFETQRRALELTSLRYSLANLRSYSAISGRETDGKLGLEAAYFDIGTGKLMVLDQAADEFRLVAQ